MSSSFILDYISGSDSGRISSRSNVWQDYSIGSSVTLLDLYFNNGSTELNLSDVYIVESVAQVSVNLANKTVSYSSGADEGTILGNFSAFTVGAYLTISNGKTFAGRVLDGFYKVKSAYGCSVVLECFSS